MHHFRNGWLRFMKPHDVRASAGYLASSFSYSRNSWMPPSGATFDAMALAPRRAASQRPSGGLGT